MSSQFGSVLEMGLARRHHGRAAWAVGSAEPMTKVDVKIKKDGDGNAGRRTEGRERRSRRKGRKDDDRVKRP